MIKKTIVQVMGMRSNKFGGIERFIAKVCEELSSQGYKSILIYEQMPTSKDYLSKLEKSDTQVLVIPARGKSAIRFAFIFAQLILKERPLAVHAHFDPAGYISMIISKLLGVKRRYRSFHSSLNANANLCQSLSELSIKTRILKRMQYAMITNAFAVSEGIKKQYKQLFNISNSKIETIYMGVEPNHYDKKEALSKYNLPANKLIITSTAFHDKIKGVDVLLEAVNIIVNKHKITDFLLCQIGAGKDTSELQKFAKDNNIDSYINWMGLQNNVPEILAASDIYIQPSRSEGISMALMEAAAAGLPMIASNVGGIPEAVLNGVTGILVKPENANDLAQKIIELIKDPILRRQLGNAAKERAKEKFDLDNRALSMTDKYINNVTL